MFSFIFDLIILFLGNKDLVHDRQKKRLKKDISKIKCGEIKKISKKNKILKKVSLMNDAELMNELKSVLKIK